MSDDQESTRAYVRRLGGWLDVGLAVLAVGSYAYLACASWALGYRWDRWIPDGMFGTGCLQVLTLVILVARTVQKSARGRMPYLTILPMCLLLSAPWVYPYSYARGERQLRQEVPLAEVARACLEVASSPVRLDGPVILARYPAIRRLHPTAVWMTPAYDFEGGQTPGSVTIYCSRLLSYAFGYDEGRGGWVLKKGSSEGGSGELLYALPGTTSRAAGTQGS